MNAALAARLGAAVRRRLRTAPPRTALGARRLAADPALGRERRRLARRVQTRVSHRDAMGRGDERYFRVGLSALDCVQAGLAATGAGAPERILDLPCGHGRVLRWLAAAFPEAQLTASDLDRHGVDWCARAFGATPAHSAADLRAVHLPGPFELIWCGSLLTHLDERRFGDLLDLFARHLAPGGTLMATTHGERAARNLEEGALHYALPLDRAAEVLVAYREAGFGYVDYPGAEGYGLSLSSPDWVRRRAGALREALFLPQGWDDHQDVFAFTAD